MNSFCFTTLHKFREIIIAQLEKMDYDVLDIYPSPPDEYVINYKDDDPVKMEKYKRNIVVGNVNAQEIGPLTRQMADFTPEGVSLTIAAVSFLMRHLLIKPGWRFRIGKIGKNRSAEQGKFGRGIRVNRVIRTFGDFRKFGDFGKSASGRGSAGAAAKNYAQIGGRRQDQKFLPPWIKQMFRLIQ